MMTFKQFLQMQRKLKEAPDVERSSEAKRNIEEGISESEMEKKPD